ncbi:expressed unknown protein [Seminavis robusta]|uniref:AP2/ERF domain-containing protein n=1 Tax=Seminavis robusta TaxID=568900 RepID=A0A9N8HNA6_9STRA|nr:expressed unknown protein [Seminavis robusta]|eukprot:Sro1193_g251170.1 n/a (737) ;mRNA; f:12326-14536
MVHVAQAHSHHHHEQQDEQDHHGEPGMDAVGRRLSVVLNARKSTSCCALVVAFFPKTHKHRLRFDDDHEKNVLLRSLDYSWIDVDAVRLSAFELAIQRDAVGRRLEVFHHVRQKWYQATVHKYVEHCQQHAVVLEPQGKVHLVDLQQCPWRYTDLIGPATTTRNTRDLATSKYMGVVRFTQGTWKAYYGDDNKYIGCFESEKDAALSYDVYARKRHTSVNFENRRICRAQMKMLRVEEPAAPKEVPSTPVVVPVTVTVTPEVIESLPVLQQEEETANIVMASSTESAEEEEHAPLEETEGPAEVEHHNDDNIVRPDPEGVHGSSMMEEENDVECGYSAMVDDVAADVQQTQECAVSTMVDDVASGAVPDVHQTLQYGDFVNDVASGVAADVQQTRECGDSTMMHDVESGVSADIQLTQEDPPEKQSGRVTPTSVTEEVHGHDGACHSPRSEREHLGHELEQHEDEPMLSHSDIHSGMEAKRRISTSSNDGHHASAAEEEHVIQQQEPVKAAPQTVCANIFEDSEDERDCGVSDDVKITSNNHKHSNNVAANIFESDEDDEESVHVTPKKKRKKKKKGSSHRHHRRVIEETLSSFDELDGKDMDSSEFLSSPTPTKKMKKIKPPPSNPKKKRKRSSSPTNPRFPVGTRFVKEFEDFGTFEGLITAYDGRHYQVFYAADGDEEELSEYEFDKYEILSDKQTTVRGAGGLNCPPTPIAQKRQKNGHMRKKKRRANAILD